MKVKESSKNICKASFYCKLGGSNRNRGIIIIRRSSSFMKGGQGNKMLCCLAWQLFWLTCCPHMEKKDWSCKNSEHFLCIVVVIFLWCLFIFNLYFTTQGTDGSTCPFQRRIYVKEISIKLLRAQKMVNNASHMGRRPGGKDAQDPCQRTVRGKARCI